MRHFFLGASYLNDEKDSSPVRYTGTRIWVSLAGPSAPDSWKNEDGDFQGYINGSKSAPELSPGLLHYSKARQGIRNTSVMRETRSPLALSIVYVEP